MVGISDFELRIADFRFKTWLLLFNSRSAIRNPKSLVHSFDYRRLQLCKRPDIAHPIPGIKLAGWFSLRLVTFEKARHEEFLRQSRQTDAARLAIVHHSFRVVRADPFDHRAGGWRVADDGKVVLRRARVVEPKTQPPR